MHYLFEIFYYLKLQVLKYSQSDVNRMRKEWELELQARMMSQQKQTEEVETEYNQEKSELFEEIEQLKKSHEQMK